MLRPIRLAVLVVLGLILSSSRSCSVSAASSLYESLSSLRYLNSGETYASSDYGWAYHGVLYGELENITTANAWWGASGSFPFLYQRDNTTVPSECRPSTQYPGEDMPGGDLMTLVLSSPSPTLCAAACCAQEGCVAYTVAVAPTVFMDCKAGDACCYLKGSVPEHHPSTDRNISSGVVVPASSPYTLHPPSGMRSAVPVGGVAAGSVELRGDGTFHEVTIVNQSPAGSAKYGVVDDAVLALRVGPAGGGQGSARLIRTHPPHGLPGVSGLRYQGSYPVGRLDVLDASLGVEASVFAYSALRPFDLNRSATPALALSVNVHNAASTAQAVSLMFNLPFAVEADYTRTGSRGLRNVTAATAVACMQQCAGESQCASWTWRRSANGCTLNSDVPPNRYELGASAGVRGQWQWEASHTVASSHASGLTAAASTPLRHVRPADPDGPTHGDLSLWPTASSDSPLSASFSLGVGDSLPALFADFADDGAFNATVKSPASAVHGAVSVSAVLQPGQNATLSVVLAWWFPHRDHVGLNIGNFYQHLFPSSRAAAQSLLGDAGEGLTTVVADIAALHSTYLNTSLPDYLADSLINSFSHVRSALWTAAGVWRQPEANDCVDYDSVHNDYQRALPYILYFPETEANKLRQHRANQDTSGMIQEELIGGCWGDVLGWDSRDDNGRRMADVTNLYVAEIYQLWKWRPQPGWLDEFWPSVQRAVAWEIGVSPQGLPVQLVDTYDILALDQYEYATFNSVLHLLGMRAAMEMARAMKDSATYDAAAASFALGQKTLQATLWHADGAYYRSYYNVKNTSEVALFADALYAQVVSNTLGLGLLLPAEQMRAHLAAEAALNDSPYGLIVQTGREPQSNQQDNAIWMGGSQDWTALSISLGMKPADAYAQAMKGLDNWRLRLNDQWNVWGLAAGMGVGMDGLHWCTSHYGFHMVLWHQPFAISGQQWDAAAGHLSFDVKLQAPYVVPVLLPGMLGRLECSEVDGRPLYVLEVTMGEADVRQLTIGGVEQPAPGALMRGRRVTWTAEAMTAAAVPVVLE